MTQRLKAIVVGAGMGGLTAALALRQAGLEVEVHERVSELAPAGAGLSLWPNGVKVLHRLGVGRRVEALGGRMQRVSYFAASGELLCDFGVQPLVDRVGQRPVPIARTDLQRALLEALGSDCVRLDSRCVALEQNADHASAVFEDGRRATGDVVVGADGTHSTVRSFVLGREVPRRYAGYVNVNGLVPVDPALAPEHHWVVYVGEGKRASLMPVGGGLFYFFLDVPLPKGLVDEPARRREALREHFAGWAPPVQALIDRLDPELSNRIEIHDFDPLERLVSGRVALLGDAAHGMTPDVGQGGCQAMEDAWVLADCLRAPKLGVKVALERYQSLRQARTADVVLQARRRADMIHGLDPERTERWYRELREEDGSRILGAIERTIVRGPLG